MVSDIGSGVIVADRFDAIERGIHWVNAALFGVLFLTAAILYLDPLAAAIGRRALVKWVHVASGLALPVPLLAGVLFRSGERFRADVTELNRWSSDDLRWLRTLGRARGLAFRKFHPGQKLNAAFTVGAIGVMLASGSVMRWFHPFPLGWRTGATAVHDWLALTLLVVVAGHIRTALRHPQAMAAMAPHMPIVAAFRAERRRPWGER